MREIKARACARGQTGLERLERGRGRCGQVAVSPAVCEGRRAEGGQDGEDGEEAGWADTGGGRGETWASGTCRERLWASPRSVGTAPGGRAAGGLALPCLFLSHAFLEFSRVFSQFCWSDDRPQDENWST